ncbi:hypothetical protein HanPI659440_Chr09g0329331 [Helianthus annuus]|nr:hypothetical protein HanPI659440_Chr09g0329331 [Helianthus annuus]
MNANVDVFASPKHHSLFPMAIPCLTISKDDYHIFYRNERRLFSLLVVILRREIAQSILVLGFLLWLEREGYTSKNLVTTIGKWVCIGFIDLVIDDVVICLKCIEKKENKLLLEGGSKRLHMISLNNLLDRKRISLLELYEDCDRIFTEVSSLVIDVCAKALGHILQQFSRRDLGPIVPSTYDVYNYLRFHRNSGLAIHQYWPIVPFGNSNCVMPNPLEQEHEVSPDDRTIFLTFSKGHPISENEN